MKYDLTEHEGMDPSETENASLRRAARLVGQRSRLHLGNFGTCYRVSGKLRVTAVCIACAGCKSRKGLSCLFEGGWLTGPAGGLLYHCTVWHAGKHSGQPATLRSKDGSATVAEKRSVEGIAEKLWATSRHFKPQDIVKELRVEKMPCPSSCVLRGITRRWRSKKTLPCPFSSRRQMATLSEDFQQFVDASHDDGFLQIRDVVFGANIVSFNLAFIGMIRWLVQLRDAGKLSGKLSVLMTTANNITQLSGAFVETFLYRGRRQIGFY